MAHRTNRSPQVELTVVQVSRLLRVSEERVLALPIARAAGRHAFRPADVVAWMKSNRRPRGILGES